MTPSCSPTTPSRVWALPAARYVQQSGSRERPGFLSFRRSSNSSRRFHHRGHRGALRCGVERQPFVSVQEWTSGFFFFSVIPLLLSFLHVERFFRKNFTNRGHSERNETSVFLCVLCGKGFCYP